MGVGLEVHARKWAEKVSERSAVTIGGKVVRANTYVDTVDDKVMISVPSFTFMEGLVTVIRKVNLSVDGILGGFELELMTKLIEVDVMVVNSDVSLCRWNAKDKKFINRIENWPRKLVVNGTLDLRYTRFDRLPEELYARKINFGHSNLTLEMLKNCKIHSNVISVGNTPLHDHIGKGKMWYDYNKRNRILKKLRSRPNVDVGEIRTMKSHGYATNNTCAYYDEITRRENVLLVEMYLKWQRKKNIGPIYLLKNSMKFTFESRPRIMKSGKKVYGVSRNVSRKKSSMLITFKGSIVDPKSREVLSKELQRTDFDDQGADFELVKYETVKKEAKKYKSDPFVYAFEC